MTTLSDAAYHYRKRLLSLAAQKFVSDIAQDAYQHARIRANGAGGRSRATQGPTSARVSFFDRNIHTEYSSCVDIGQDEDDSHDGRPQQCACGVRYQLSKARLLHVGWLQVILVGLQSLSPRMSVAACQVLHPSIPILGGSVVISLALHPQQQRFRPLIRNFRRIAPFVPDNVYHILCEHHRCSTFNVVRTNHNHPTMWEKT